MNTLVIDTETGGLIPETHGLCSITLKVFGKDEHKTIFIKPQRALVYAPDAMKITGISLDYLEQEGVDEITAIKEIIHFIRENFDRRPKVLGHNVGFDILFLDALFKRHANTTFSELIHHHRKDTLYNMIFLKDSGVVNIESLTLGNCYSCLSNKPVQNAHSSHGDVLMTEELYKLQIKLIGGNKDA